MNTESDQNVPEEFRRIVHRAHRLLNTLEREYFEIRPQHGQNGFRERVFNRMNDFSITNPGDLVLPTGDVRVEKVTEFIEIEGDAIESDLWWIYMACAHTVASARALQVGDRDLAWELLCDAHKSTGVVLVTNRSEEIFTKTVVDLFNKSKASKAGEARHRQTAAMKARVHEIMRSRNDWLSQSNAALSVEVDLKAEFGEKALRDFEGTITGWIKAMPDRLELIPSLKKRLSQP